MCTHARHRDREWVVITAIHNVQVGVGDSRCWLTYGVLTFEWQVLHHTLLVHIANLTYNLLHTYCISHYLVDTFVVQFLTIYVVLWCLGRVNSSQDYLRSVLSTLHHIVCRRNHIRVELVHTQVTCIGSSQQQTCCHALAVTNIVLQFGQNSDWRTHWHLVEDHVLPCYRITFCVRSILCHEGAVHLLMEHSSTWHILSELNQEVTETVDLLFEHGSITLANSVLSRNISIILLANLAHFSIFLGFLTIGQEYHVILECLHILKELVWYTFHLHRLVIPLLCLLWVLVQSSFEGSVCLSVTILHSLNCRMQTIVHLRVSVQDSCTDVERQHGGQHQVHHTYHLLSRSFRTVSSSTHTLLISNLR